MKHQRKVWTGEQKTRNINRPKRSQHCSCNVDNQQLLSCYHTWIKH